MGAGLSRTCPKCGKETLVHKSICPLCDEPFLGKPPTFWYLLALITDWSLSLSGILIIGGSIYVLLLFFGIEASNARLLAVVILPIAIYFIWKNHQSSWKGLKLKTKAELKAKAQISKPLEPLVSKEEYDQIDKKIFDNLFFETVGWGGPGISLPDIEIGLPDYDKIKYRPETWRKIVDYVKEGWPFLPEHIFKELGIRSTSDLVYSNSYPDNWDEIAKEVRKRDGHRCKNCGSHSTTLHVHHIVPLSRGGSNEYGNLITLCDECHKKIHPHMR